ncbi:uncharacterized protein LOC125561134 [Nematostella vectensis]|uniref:uncharacterized protein LOC125561134 n=1 Tax=Nematostella vectensis TaxID=45351 RepID=UPI0020773F85|nr:uncharacterized protein LOC125561134 [Nematostella vectensis]
MTELTWDEELTGEVRKEWKAWVKDLGNLISVEVPRCVLDTSNRKVQIHGSADASRKAYCAVVYLVYDVGGERQVKLLCSKTRVAPHKEMTIPRLELMAALILARLVSHVKEALGTLIEEEREVYWSNSKTVLYWLANKGEWKQFVKHRVDEILQLTRNGEWRHCSGEQNPADIGSRGALASKLESSALWWNGPHWLTGPEQGWPALQIERTPAGAEEEKGTISMVVNTRVPKSDISSVINPNNFSNCSKLFKVTAYVRRFMHNVRAEKVEDRMTGRLSRKEMTNAELEWIKSAQVDLKQQATFNQVTKQLDLVEEAGLLRCRGRLGNSELATDARMPIILPRDHRLTELVILDCP